MRPREKGEPGFLITGSGRSGTEYIAEVLRRCGLNVGHEQWWGLDRRQEPNLDGDVSWLGCFDRSYTGPVYAQVRDPRTAIPSMVANERHPWSLIRAQNVMMTGDRSVDACRIWLTYTKRAIARSGPTRWWQVEDVDPYLLLHQFNVPLAAGRRAIRQVPTNINHKREVPDFDWPDDVMLMEQVRALAWILGYDREVGS